MSSPTNHESYIESRLMVQSSPRGLDFSTAREISIPRDDANFALSLREEKSLLWENERQTQKIVDGKKQPANQPREKEQAREKDRARAQFVWRQVVVKIDNQP